MKILHILWIVAQLSLALFSHDQNRIAYLLYLVGWNSREFDVSSKRQNGNRIKHGGYQETQSDITNYEYSLLLEK